MSRNGSFPDNLIARRLGGRNFGQRGGYKFAGIKRAREEALRLNPNRPLLDFGVGEPDQSADVSIRNRLWAECGRKENRFYADNGIDPFRDACLDYLEGVYSVRGLARENILHGIGSKAILAQLPYAFINRGDMTIMSVPGYPILGTHTLYAGGGVYPCPLKKENRFLPDLASIPRRVRKKAKLFYINYPNNPTGQVADGVFYEKILDFAYDNDLLIVQDCAYGAFEYEKAPLSILSVPGGRERAVEVHSLSKAFNMTGWRIAFLAGPARVIKLFGAIKDNSDSGQFRPIQLAACEALSRPELTEAYKTKYRRRLDLLSRTLGECGFDASPSPGTFYLYVPAPRGTEGGERFDNAAEAASFLIKEASLVTVPWDEAGPFLRFSVTYEAEGEWDEMRIMEEVKKRLDRLKLTFARDGE